MGLLKLNLPKIGSKKVSIDWGSSALKVVFGTKSKNSYLVNDFTSQKIEDDLPASLSRMWQIRKFPDNNIVLTLDGASTLVRVVDFPRMEKNAIKESLGFELSKYIPFSQDEVYFDFSVLNIPAAHEHIKLLIASVKKNFVDEKLSVLESAGIVPSKITLSSIALVNAFLKFFTQEEAPVGILDMGFSYSMITIVYKNNIYLSREVKKGAKDILLSLSNILGIKLDNFQDLNDNKDEIKPELLSEVSSDLIEEVRLSLDYLETKENLSVKRLYATGGLTSFQGLNDIMVRALGVEIVQFNVLKHFPCAKSIQEDLQRLEGNFSVALGSLL